MPPVVGSQISFGWHDQYKPEAQAVRRNSIQLSLSLQTGQLSALTNSLLKTDVVFANLAAAGVSNCWM